MTALAFASDDLDCPGCVKDSGLCHRDTCRKAVLPQLAKPALVRLIGDTLVEQKSRQVKIDRRLPVSPEAKAHQSRVESARTIARSKRRGYFGLAKAIMAAK